jgi:hypothetical protein
MTTVLITSLFKLKGKNVFFLLHIYALWINQTIRINSSLFNIQGIKLILRNHTKA